MNIFFPIEWFSRDLDSRLLITSSILKNNKAKDVKIFIGGSRKLGQLSYSLNEYFVWLATGIETSFSWFKKLASHKGSFISLDEEGGVHTKNLEKNYPRHITQIKYGHFAAKIFIWGKREFKNYLQDFKLNKKNSLIISGNPRFDLAKKKFFAYYENNSLKYDVLINAAFGLANPDISLDDQRLYWKLNASSKFFGAIISQPFVSETENYQKKNIKCFLVDIKKLVNKFSDIKFALRCHPTENIKTYTKFFKNEKNLKILNNYYSVMHDINKAKLIIHPGCTTAIESFFNNKLYHCHINNRDKFNEQYLPVNISSVTSSYEELEIFFNNFLKKKFKLKNKKKNKVLLSQYISNVYNDSYKIISNEIMNLNIEKENKILIKKIENYNDIEVSNFFWKVKKKFLQLIYAKQFKKIQLAFNKRNKRKKLIISKDLIKKKIDKLLKIEGVKINYSVKKINEECFVINKI